MSIREATTKDANKIADVHINSWQAAYTGLVPGNVLENVDRDNRAGMWLGAISGKPHETIVSLVSNSIVGFANFGESRDTNDTPQNGEIRALYVLKDYWRRGIGCELLNYAEEFLKQKYKYSVLWVLDSNDKAIEFYEKQGYAKDGASKTETIFEATLSEIRMVKTINS